MRRLLATVLVFVVAAVTGSTVRADDCFCLTNAATDAILRGCEAYKASTDFYSTAVCTDPISGKPYEQTLYPDGQWQRIEAGADRCDPCRPQPRGAAAELPRGGETAPASQGAKP